LNGGGPAGSGERELPLRPDLAHLQRQARELLAGIRAGAPDALATLSAWHPTPPLPAAARLADAQRALARAHGARSWTRLAQAVRLSEALWAGDADAVEALLDAAPRLATDDVRIRRSNWGPPLSYAATLGQLGIVERLLARGIAPTPYALDRAILTGHLDVAARLHAALGAPPLASDVLAGAAYTLSVTGTRFALERGAPVVSPSGARLAPVDVVLETDSRNPAAKHAILELYVQHGLTLPDTAPMAVHRGRVDLLEGVIARDPAALSRPYAWDELFPQALGCHDDVLATHGTPLVGATLLHLAVDMDEWAIAEWLLAHGFPVDARAAVDADGFGGHTALFATVVSQQAFWMHHHDTGEDARFAELLLAHGADPMARASLRKELHPGYDVPGVHEVRDVTPIGWGERFHFPKLVNRAAMAAIAARGGSS
jgi:ankyrin repeat protein